MRKEHPRPLATLLFLLPILASCTESDMVSQAPEPPPTPAFETPPPNTPTEPATATELVESFHQSDWITATSLRLALSTREILSTSNMISVADQPYALLAVITAERLSENEKQD